MVAMVFNVNGTNSTKNADFVGNFREIRSFHSFRVSKGTQQRK